MNVRKAIFILFMVPVLGATSEMAGSQSLSFSLDSTAKPTNITSGGFAPSYTRPTPREKIHSFGLNTFGPIPLVESAGSAGIDQFDNSPPEWKQGAAGYGKRFGSDFGTAAVGTTTRYALSEAFRDDSLYYRCECTGIFPRVGHAAISSLTARRGQDGHRAFSLPALLAPYAGSSAAVYGWYPDRYGAKDAFRMGNYSLLTSVFGNIALEFLHSVPSSLFHRRPLDNEYEPPAAATLP
jgi:hypothetical protein